ncbi:hypothetical protein P9112_000158 [Eukaryota sp. TZLM1-RC]
MTLKRTLNTADVFSICAGAMVSSGIFLLPSIAYGLTGPSMIVAYIIAGFSMVPAAYIKAELATAMPISGLTFFSVFRSLGSYFGTICGFASWLSITFKTAFACVGLASLYSVFEPNAKPGTLSLIAIVIATVFTVINTLTLDGTKSLQKILVFVLLLILSFFSIYGLKEVPENGKNFTPFMTDGIGSLFATAGTVYVAFGGLTKIVAVSEEIKRPSKTIPRGMFLSFYGVLAIYVLLLIVVVAALSPDALSNSYTPIADAAAAAIGDWAGIAINIASFLAYATTVNSGILSAARSPVAMSRDKILPDFLSKSSQKFKTPVNGIIATYVILVVCLAFLSIEGLAKVASAQFLLSNLLVMSAGLVFGLSRFPSYQPRFKTLLFPYMNVAGIIINIVLLVDMGSISWISTSVMLVAVAVWYFIYVLPRNKQTQCVLKYLLSHPDAESRSSVEDELFKIRTADIKKDHFDYVTDRATVIETDCKDSRELFRTCADAVNAKFGIPPNNSFNMFVDAEFNGGFDIVPHVAVFNLAVVDTKDFLELFIVRSKKGVKFYDGSVCNIMFALVSSREFSSNFLQCYNSLCKAIAYPTYLKQAMTVRSLHNLKELLLVSYRKRYPLNDERLKYSDVFVEVSIPRVASTGSVRSRKSSIGSNPSDSDLPVATKVATDNSALPPLMEHSEGSESPSSGQ